MAKKLQRKIARPMPATPARAPDGRVARKTPWIVGRSVSPAALAEFTTQLAVLLDAGIPITKCLRILEGQMKPGLLRRTVAEVLEDVESGTSLSEALAKHGRIFDDLYTNMVRAGEAGGVQEEILNRLAGFMEKSEEIKARVKGALAYPIAIVCVAMVVLVLVFIFVIPKFKEIFEQQFGSIDKMPWATRVIIQTGEHLESYWWSYALAATLLFGLHRLLLAKVPSYRRGRDTLILRIPIFGILVAKSLVARFTRTFGTLIQSGVPHLNALEIVRASLGNVRMSSAVGMIHGSIREGAGIAVPMGESGMFDDIVINMVDVGEQTGELDRMLTKIADRYETEVDRTIDTTFSVIETLMILILAVVVGFIVFALFSPLLKLMESLK
jgi:type IV pilus assembly protein PilC